MVADVLFIAFSVMAESLAGCIGATLFLGVHGHGYKIAGKQA